MNCNVRDKLFSHMRPLLDILETVKLVYASVLEFDLLSKYVIKFWSRNVRTYTTSDGQMNIFFKLQTFQSMRNCNN